MRRPGSGAQEALGVQIDGQQVLVAHLGRRGKQMRLMGLGRSRLVRRLDLEGGEEAASEQAEAADILGLAEEAPAAPPEQGEEQAPQSNAEVLYGLLNRFPLNRCTLAVSLLETSVFYRAFDDAFGLKGKKLGKRLREEAAKERSGEGLIPLEERHAFFATGRGRLLSIVHEDPLEILGLLDELKPFVGRVQIGLVEPLEIALMDLARLAYSSPLAGGRSLRRPGPGDEEATALVFVGEDFSRVLFMKGGEYLAFSQPIHEGAHAPQVLRTIYSRILFEQDSAELPAIGRLLLGGECQALQAQPFFAEQFPEAQVDYLAPPGLDLSDLEEEKRQELSAYAVPIGLAWKALGSRAMPFYPVNLLPRARRRQQNPFELAWHGLALFALLVASALFLAVRADQQQERMQALRHSLALVQEQVEEHRAYAQRMDGLYARIGEYERRFALIDTLAGRRVSWSGVLREVADACQEAGGLWLEHFATVEGELDVQRNLSAQAGPREFFLSGKATWRQGVPRIAERLGDGHIPSLVRTQIRGRTVYQFALRVPLGAPAKEP
jgi:hypothetical protein